MNEFIQSSIAPLGNSMPIELLVWAYHDLAWTVLLVMYLFTYTIDSIMFFFCRNPCNACLMSLCWKLLEKHQKTTVLVGDSFPQNFSFQFKTWPMLNNIVLWCRWCHLVSFGWCFGYIAFFRTAHMFGLPEVVAHANAVQLFLTLRVRWTICLSFIIIIIQGLSTV